MSTISETIEESGKWYVVSPRQRVDDPLGLDPMVPGRANPLNLWSWQYVTAILFAYKGVLTLFG